MHFSGCCCCCKFAERIDNDDDGGDSSTKEFRRSNCAADACLNHRCNGSISMASLCAARYWHSFSFCFCRRISHHQHLPRLHHRLIVPHFFSFLLLLLISALSMDCVSCRCKKYTQKLTFSSSIFPSQLIQHDWQWQQQHLSTVLISLVYATANFGQDSSALVLTTDWQAADSASISFCMTLNMSEFCVWITLKIIVKVVVMCVSATASSTKLSVV